MRQKGTLNFDAGSMVDLNEVTIQAIAIRSISGSQSVSGMQGSKCPEIRVVQSIPIPIPTPNSDSKSHNHIVGEDGRKQHRSFPPDNSSYAYFQKYLVEVLLSFQNNFSFWC
jgi:hypothetical protein